MNDLNAKLFGLDLFGEAMVPRASGPVAERFVVPPFTILDARSGEWQDRKRAWLDMGIRGEIGRDAASYNTTEWIKEKGLSGGCQSIPDPSQEWTGTSIFDPVICELAYRWFCPAGGQVVDPFAGGSVRGIVAGALGLRYWGCDLRQEQIDANEKQATAIPTEPKPVWVCGDSMDTLGDAPAADLVFSCPPYGDLERYSDDPRDLSAMEWHTFAANYKRIILRATQRLKPSRFAMFVVGDFRDDRGFYRNFVSETIRGFEDAGARLYNEAILATAIGSAAMRVTKQFEAGRKLAKTHQNILVFCNGDWRGAARACVGTTV